MILITLTSMVMHRIPNTSTTFRESKIQSINTSLIKMKTISLLLNALNFRKWNNPTHLKIKARKLKMENLQNTIVILVKKAT
jgi:hypothetical protein